MAKSLHLVNPRSELPSYFGAEVYRHWGLDPTQSIADLATTTVAALAPPDWDVSICEEYVEPVDFDIEADYVGITGKVTQVSRMIEVAREFRRRGRTVIIGGPYASLCPEAVREHCDVLVVGELEGIAEQFFADLEAGTPRREYTAERPELDSSPVPRWDLYPNDKARTGCVQTSRGCPFACEFCDVIVYLGRTQRHKPIAHVMAELDRQHELGYRQVFLADDNFTASRKRAKELLVALRRWNDAHEGDPVSFSTQLSIDAARDGEMMDLLAQAGMTWVFIGIETPNVESLKETKKGQNLGCDLGAQVQVFLDHGIQVTGGMIVGFDHDGPDMFQRQYDFAMSTPIPIFSLGALVAPAATPLHARLKAAGRLVEGGAEVAGSPIASNIVPERMTREELMQGVHWLVNRLYTPEAFTRRMISMIDRMGPQRGPFRREKLAPRNPRAVEAVVPVILKKLIKRGAAERRMWLDVQEALKRNPEAEPNVMAAMYFYAQVRCLYDVGQLWEPHVAEAAAPKQVVAPPSAASAGTGA